MHLRGQSHLSNVLAHPARLCVLLPLYEQLGTADDVRLQESWFCILRFGPVSDIGENIW